MEDISIIEQLKNFLNEDKKLKQYPRKRKLQILSLFYLASKFESGKNYTEKEVNELINLWHTFNDNALLRRFLYQCGFLDRKNDGSLYWLKEPAPLFDEFKTWIGIKDSDTKLIKSNLRDFYNKEAIHRNTSERQDWKIEQRDLFYGYIKNENKKSLLEIGAGAGHDSKFFIDCGLDVTAIDISEEMINLCKAKHINAHLMDVYNITELNTKFDCVWAMNSLLHVPKPDLKKVLYSINSILNDGGLFYMGVYGGEDTETSWVNDISDTPRYFSYYSKEKLEALLQNIFEVISFKQFDVGRNIDFQSIIMRRYL